MTFSPEQQLYISQTRRHVMAVAVPGAGKTGTAVRKVITLLQRGESATVVTFTKLAAKELKAKILAGIPSDWHSRCSVGTFHGLAFKDLHALPSNPVRHLKNTKKGHIADQRRLALKAFDFPPEDRSSMAIFERAYSRLHDPFGLVEAHGLAQGDPARDEAIALAERKQRMVTSYEDGLARNGLFDMARLLLTAYEHMQQGHHILRSDHFFVDEYQDVDEVQQGIILLLKEHCRIDVVGDDDQSIYGFRNGLGYTAFQDLKAKLAPQVIHFTINFRSQASILNCANAVIAQNKKRYPKKLHSNRGPGGEVRLLQLDDELQEYEAVAELVQAAVNAGVKSVAILSRGNEALQRIQPALIARELEYQCSKKDALFESSPCSVLAGLLQYIADPSAIAGLEHALDIFGAEGPEIVEMRQAANGRAIVEVFDQFCTAELVGDGCRLAMERLQGLLERLEAFRNQEPIAYAGTVISETSLAIYEAVALDPRLTLEQRTAGMNLIDVAEGVLMKLQGSLKQRLNAIQRSRQAAAECSIRLMTMHGSKGLEFETVFIIQAADHVLPGVDTSLENVEEERRLLYVAITRARDALFISWASRYGQKGRQRDASITRLLEVAGVPVAESWNRPRG